MLPVTGRAERPARSTARGHEVDRPRPRRRWLRRIVVAAVVLVVVVAAVLGDAVARGNTERQVADQIAGYIGASGDDVGVHIGGWPFLAVLVTDRVSSLDLTVPSATLERDDQRLTFNDVAVHADGIRNARDPDEAVVDRADARGRVSWAEISRLSGSTISYQTGSRVQLVRNLSVLGGTVAVKISAVPGIDTDQRKIVLTSPQASLDGITIPSSLLTPAVQAVADRIVLPDLGNLKYQSITPQTEGLKISLSGTGVAVKDLTGR